MILAFSKSQNFVHSVEEKITSSNSHPSVHQSTMINKSNYVKYWIKIVKYLFLCYPLPLPLEMEYWILLSIGCIQWNNSEGFFLFFSFLSNEFAPTTSSQPKLKLLWLGCQNFLSNRIIAVPVVEDKFCFFPHKKREWKRNVCGYLGLVFTELVSLW